MSIAELKYLNLLRKVRQADKRDDRTGTGTLSEFGTYMEFDLVPFPLFTTSKMFFRGIAEELHWMVSGSTYIGDLRSKGVHIWDANSDRKALIKMGLSQFNDDGTVIEGVNKCGLPNYPEYEGGKIYPFQWRHWGGTYNPWAGIKGLSHQGGIDQLANAIKIIHQEPTSRRNVMIAWNPADFETMCLPPCHHEVQFYVKEGTLSLKFDMRSSDLFLGLKWNIAFYALFAYEIAAETQLKLGKMAFSLGDHHIYQNHLAAVDEVTSRTAYPLPTLSVEKAGDIGAYTMQHLKLENYQYHPAVKAEMSA